MRETKSMKKNLICKIGIYLAIWLIVCGSSPVWSQAHTLYSNYVDGFGSDHGWLYVDCAEGYNPYSFALKFIDINPYRLLKAYSFNNWVQSQPISSVKAVMHVYVEDCSYMVDSLLVQLRARLEDVTVKTVTVNVPRETYYKIEMLIPVPSGGWTKQKVDDIELWLGSAELAMAYLRAYYFSLEIYY